MPFYNKELREYKEVYGPGFTLTEETKDNYSYPVIGLYWAENARAAGPLHGLTTEETEAAIMKLIAPSEEGLQPKPRPWQRQSRSGTQP